MLTTNRIADLFNIKKRFIRSTHLERDFGDSGALEGYVVTPPAREGFERLLHGLSPKSSQRAWRVTGDYGTGKSSFALALAHLLFEEAGGVPKDIRGVFDFRSLGVKKPNLLPVLVTGTRASLAQSLRMALARALEEQCKRGKPPQLIQRLRESQTEGNANGDGTSELALLTEAAQFVKQSGKADGLLIILDELGKFLEFAAFHPDRQDIYLLQMLAEAASRSGDTPIFVVGLLHQGFHAYAEQLTLSSQKEWDKVAGRFEEILFNQPLEQTTALVASALNIRCDRLPRGAAGRLEDEMAHAVKIGWFGSDAIKGRMVATAPDIFPLHPTVIPVLVKLFSRFGQNERSLYSFLLSNEPYALQSFCEQAAKPDSFYRLHNLYDFARAAFGHRLALQSFRSHWNQIESVVESFPHDQTSDLNILKSVAILNLIDSPLLLASEEAIALAVDGSSDESASRVKRSLKALQRGKAVLYYRGVSGGYCLWPHTSVNLERAYQDARDALPVPQRISALIREQLETRPLVARKHYIETGNLRHFDVQFVPASDLQSAVNAPTIADGKVLVALCETELERKKAIEYASTATLNSKKGVLIAVPQPLQGLTSLVAEVQRWEWIEQNIPELNHDGYAQEEVTRQLAASRHVLNKRLQSYVGLRQFGETLGLGWFYRGKPVELATGRALLEKLSQVCDKLYPSAPAIQNELVNRHEPSSAAAAARLRLIDLILKHASEPYLGMSRESKPPEMSMYLSVLQAAKLHQEGGETWKMCVPAENEDVCNVRPVLNRMREILESAKGKRVKVTDVFEEMKAPPFGVRDGLCPLLFAVFIVIHEQDVAIYDGGSFMKQVVGQDLHRLIKATENFEVQYCRIAGVRTVVFEQLFKVLHPEKKPGKAIDLLDVVRPLCVFAAQLPDFAKKSARVSKIASSVRETLLKAEEPATLLFQSLPEACGCDAFDADTSPSSQRVKRFVERLRDAIEELRAAYPQLLQKMKDEFLLCFNRPDAVAAGTGRASVEQSANRVLASVKEPRLKAFCMRLVDRGLDDDQWIESLGSFLCSKHPSKWLDNDLSQYEDELNRYARQFFRVESTVFDGSELSEGTQAMRVSITRQDGTEIDRVVLLDQSEVKRVTELENSIRTLFGKDGRLGLIAATRAIWGQLQSENESK
jgi:hypothetical protein